MNNVIGLFDDDNLDNDEVEDIVDLYTLFLGFLHYINDVDLLMLTINVDMNS